MENGGVSVNEDSVVVYLTDKISATMSPYNPSTSAKIRIKIMPTNNLGCCAVPLTPASPTIPIANPAAMPLSPTLRPAPRWRKLLAKRKFVLISPGLH